jgi:hypothetical protein
MPCGTLDIGHGRRVSGSQYLKPLAAHKAKPKVPQQLFIMGLTNAEEVHDLAVEIVQYLDLRRLLPKKHLSSPGKRFDKGRVPGEGLNNLFCQYSLSSYI